MRSRMMAKKKEYSHDVKCYDLAEYFLGDSTYPVTEKDIKDLAQEIQQVIEDWFWHFEEANKKPK